MTLSKIENRSYKTEFIDYNLPDLIKEFVKNLQGYSLAQKKQIVVLSDSEFIPIKIDQNLLMKVINNVLQCDPTCIEYNHDQYEDAWTSRDHRDR